MILIDVRTKNEYSGGHIEGAINHDIMEMMQGNFPNIDKESEVCLYCESGNRSMMAKNFMENAGFKNVKDLGSIDNLR
ncbi:MAG: hypothetical protein HQK78_16820 [Desulfobacterales bacterium]|nr:hypothetical protein [Desulfobacterales bacterium]